jgi:ribosomal protein S18 acetylase RimI-like enzyme
LLFAVETHMVREENVSIRRAGRSDAPALAALRAESLIEMGLLSEPARPAFVAEATAHFAALFSGRSLQAWLLVEDTRPVGCACAVFWDRLLYPDGHVHAEIAGVYVAPGYRRRGFASALVREAIADARRRGARKIILHPTTLSRPLYERLGFGAAHQMQLRA